MQRTAITIQRLTKLRVPLTAARLKFGSFGRAKMIKNCKAANLAIKIVIM